MPKLLERVLVVAAGTVGSLAIDKLKQNPGVAITVVAPRENETINALRPHDRWLTPEVFAQEKDQGVKPYDMAVFALKPQVLGDELGKYADVVAENTTIILTAAGKDTAHADERLAKGRDLSYVRIMPNTPMKIGRGVIAYYAKDDIDQRHVDRTQTLFAETDFLYRVPRETQMHEATAATGSGPGFVFELLYRHAANGTSRETVINDFQTAIDTVKARSANTMPETGPLVSQPVREGIAFIDAYKKAVDDLDFVSPELADTIVITMIEGSLEHARQSPDMFATLRNKVTSKGGTTEAGLKAWDDCRDDMTQCVHETIFAANERSHALARPAV